MGFTTAGRGAEMIAVVISEIAGWLKEESRTTISIMVIIIGLIGSFSFIRPEFCLETLAAIILWVAIKAGNENWSEFTLQDWVKRTKLSLRNLIIGKVLAALTVYWIHLIFIFPVLIIMKILWGFTWFQLANVLLTILIAALIVTGFGLCGSCLKKDEENVIASILIGVWIVLTALIPFIRPFNPFYYIWNALASDILSLRTLLIHLANLMVVVLSINLAEYFFRKEARYV